MAHPRKHSRLITVSGQQYRWHVDLDDDTADEKLLSVYPAEDPNGARLAMTLCNPTSAPSLVRLLILVGTHLGYAPHDHPSRACLRDPARLPTRDPPLRH